MICTQCMRDRRRSFFTDGMCEDCRPVVRSHDPPPRDSLPIDPAWTEWIADLMLEPEERQSDDLCAVVLAARRGWMTRGEWDEAAALFTNREKREADKPIPTGIWLGVVGVRQDIPGCQCTEVRDLGVNPDHPEWGGRHLIRFTSAAGHELVWFASEGGTFDPKVGETYNIRGTVKKHDEYEGKRSTIINRVQEKV